MRGYFDVIAGDRETILHALWFHGSPLYGAAYGPQGEIGEIDAAISFSEVNARERHPNAGAILQFILRNDGEDFIMLELE